MYKNLQRETKLFSLIPIYSRSLDEWKKKYNTDLKKYLFNQKKLYESQKIQFDEKFQFKFELRFNERCTPWRYNDIIGFLELRTFNKDLQLYLFNLKSKGNLSGSSHKKFLFDETFKHLIQNFFNCNLLKQQKILDNSIKTLKEKYPRLRKSFFDTEMVYLCLELIKK